MATQHHDTFRSMTRGVARFRGEVFPQHRALYHRLIMTGKSRRP